MGSHSVEQLGSDSRRRFIQNVLADLTALQRMIEGGAFDDTTRRIGAEQEIVLIDAGGRPAPVALDLLRQLDDERFTTEIALFNLEMNEGPLDYGGNCLRQLEANLTAGLRRVAEVGESLGVRPILTGILPTLRKSDLTEANITPRPRYIALMHELRALRGDAYDFRFTGVDELIMRHESIMLEACNTSTQFHFQASPEEFPTLFNAAQAIAGPVLAVAANSPLLFGKRLWRETRIALFQQAIDTRRPIHAFAQRSARVRFGETWLHDSVLELFREDVTRFRALLGGGDDEDSLAELLAGRIPRLKALQLHNGTVYRWNRACYGLTNGRPHLRIESRMLPSGPTVVDEVANAALWFGLLSGVVRTYGDVSRVMRFDVARQNFNLAARLGLDSRMKWIDGTEAPADELVTSTLLPLAREGLRAGGIDAADIDRYLGIVEERAVSGRTGARWMLDSFERPAGCRTPIQKLDGLVNAMWSQQQEGLPVHDWKTLSMEDAPLDVESYARVDQFMTTDVFSVRSDDVIDLVASIMDWHHVRHVPVEDDERNLVGLVSYRQLLRFL
ncbi:MAG: CBS domain-containing protein, partial [Planctomycetota bacterium]